MKYILELIISTFALLALPFSLLLDALKEHEGANFLANIFLLIFAISIVVKFIN